MENLGRTLRAKRIYSMGQYQNIEMSDEITGIPPELALDEDFIAKLSLLQLIRLEVRINKYYMLRSQTRDMSPEEAIALLEDERVDLIEEINSKLSPK